MGLLSYLILANEISFVDTGKMHANRISMELPILHFKGLQVEITKL